MKNYLSALLIVISFMLPRSGICGDLEIENFVKRLYVNILGRDADPSGLSYWKESLKNGKSAVSVARGFFRSSEFKGMNLSDEEFLRRSYRTFFDREPDKGGENYWLNLIRREGVLREQVFYGFAFSKEFEEVCKRYGIVRDLPDDRLRAFVERFYNYIFKRDAGESEIDYWFERLKSYDKTPSEVVRYFFFSKEFESQNVNNEEFIKRAYRTVMGREPDEGGVNYWIGELENGKSRMWVLNAFLESEEFERLKEEFMPPSGEVYYVSVNGNDNNPGTLQKPFRTIQKAANVVKPGDTVYVRGGTYVGRVYIHTSGSKGKYITFRNYPGETPVITRNDRDYYKQTVLGEGVSYVRFMGFKIDKTVAVAIRFQGPGEHIEVKNNEISFQNENVPENERIGKAVVFAGYKNAPLRYVLIEGNRIHHNHTGRKGRSSEALTVYGKVEYFKIVNNKVYDNDFIGIDIIGKDTGNYAHLGTPRYGIVRDNELYGNGKLNIYSSSIYLDGGEDILVENNYVHENFGPGIAVNQEEKDSFIKHVVIRRNVLYKNYYNSFGSSSYGGIVEDSVFIHNTLYSTKVYDPSKVKEENLFYLGKGERNVVKNNLFYKDGGWAFINEVVGRNNSSPWEIDYNGFFPLISLHNQIIIGGVAYKSLESYKTHSSHAVSASDPMISSDFHLKKGSLCIDKGAFLTFTSSSGKGRVVKVEDARYFTGRWGLESGERIKIGKKSAVVLKSDYKNKTVTIDRELSWNKGEGVTYDFEGAAPDIGAYEYR